MKLLNKLITFAIILPASLILHTNAVYAQPSNSVLNLTKDNSGKIWLCAATVATGFVAYFFWKVWQKEVDFRKTAGVIKLRK